MATYTPNTKHQSFAIRTTPTKSISPHMKVSLIIKSLMIELFTNSQQIVTYISLFVLYQRRGDTGQHAHKKEKIRDIFLKSSNGKEP
jgi:hypothetical protein